MPGTLALNDGSRLPALGFGLYKVPIEQTAEVTLAGIEAGYRLVDGARFYGNERELGEAIRSGATRCRVANRRSPTSRTPNGSWASVRSIST